MYTGVDCVDEYSSCVGSVKAAELSIANSATLEKKFQQTCSSRVLGAWDITECGSTGAA